MKVSYNWLKQYINNLPRPEKLVDLLNMHSFETEQDNIILDIDVLPNRAHDCLSYIGIAQECAAIAGLKFKLNDFKLKQSLKANDFIKIENKDIKACPRYTARVITNIKVGKSPDWLKQKLEEIGQNSINNIVDATNYVMFETGQPLHAFDYDKLKGKRIIIRKAKKGEKIITLDNEICELNTEDLVIADSDNVLALAGIKGGKKAEISNKTKTIVLESANFNYLNIRKTSKKTGIRTESSLRFEHELDPNLTSNAINRVAGLIQEIAHGEVSDLIDIYPKKIYPKKIKLNLNKLENVVGIKISKEKAIKILKSLGFDINISLLVTVPTIRKDINIEEDLIEEIVRLIGYENIPIKAPLGLLGINKIDNVLSIVNRIKSIFEGFGFVETYNFSFIGENDFKKIGNKGYIELENPLSIDLKYLRRDLLINLLKNVRSNFKKNKLIKIFELGKIYSEKKEEKMLAGIIASVSEKSKGDIFYELKGVIDGLFNRLGITDYWYDDFEATPEWTDKNLWQKDNTAEIKIGNQEIGFIGEINKNILDGFNIKGIIIGFNINFEKVLKLVQDELIYQLPSVYPAAIRDLAILINKGDRVIDVLNIINNTGGKLIRDIDLFDMYEGNKIPMNKKNLAFHIIYQSYEKTLKDKEIDKIQKKIIRELEKKNGWEVRK